MADVRPIKKGTSTQFAEMGGSDTIPASLIGIVPKFEVPSGTVNGSNTAFTLSGTPVANASVIMVLDGVTQTNGTDYTVSGTTVTFTTAPASGTEIVAIYNSAASAGGGDFSSNTSSSVDGEVVLFSGASGKTGKRATGTGIAKLISGVLSALSSAQATTELDNFVGDSGSGGTKGLVPAPSTGDAAAAKFLKADGTWAAPAGGGASVITPSQITSDQDDYAPTGWASATHVRLSGDSTIRAITSFSASGISGGHEKTLLNIGTDPIYFPGEHPDGTAANRILTRYDFFLFQSCGVKIVYDGTLQRWMLLSSKPLLLTGVYYDLSFGSPTSGDWAVLTWGSSGTGAVQSFAQATSGLPGAMTAGTGTTTTGITYVSISKTLTTPVWFSGSHIAVHSNVSVPVLSDGTNTFTVGVQITATPTSTSFAANNTVGIRYSNGINSGKWEGFSKDNSGSETTVDLGITVVAGTLYVLRVELNKENTEVRFYLNGVMSGRITANLPSSVAVAPRWVIIKNAGTTARLFYCHRFALEGIY